MSQLPLPEALQLPPSQPLGPPMSVTRCDPANEVGLNDDGSSVKLLHVDGEVPSCVTENTFPAIIALADRDDVDGF